MLVTPLPGLDHFHCKRMSELCTIWVVTTASAANSPCCISQCSLMGPSRVTSNRHVLLCYRSPPNSLTWFQTYCKLWELLLKTPVIATEQFMPSGECSTAVSLQQESGRELLIWKDKRRNEKERKAIQFQCDEVNGVKVQGSKSTVRRDGSEGGRDRKKDRQTSVYQH